MAYLIFTANGYEIDRRELAGPTVIGRAPDADVHIRDILLSRHHCKFEAGDGKKKGSWVVTDLGSKNGTYIGTMQITRYTLRDGDELRLGRTCVTFRGGVMDPNERGTRRPGALVRPADPAEALEGTVSGFVLVEPDEVEREAGAPVPKPRPPEPSSYDTEDVYGMINEIASSSWDSIQEQASRPIVRERPLPRPKAYAQGISGPPQHVARSPRVAFSLQAHPETPAPLPAPVPAPVVEETKSPRRRTVLPRMRRPAMLAGVAVLATSALVGGWLAVVLGAAQFEMRRLANANPPRVTSELLVVEPPALEPTDQAAPASQTLPADEKPQVDLEHAPADQEDQAATFTLPPRPILISALRDVAVHGLVR